jgi:murein DD-endopeptidase MepM/ murein hydrolase activator NlpD
MTRSLKVQYLSITVLVCLMVVPGCRRSDSDTEVVGTPAAAETTMVTVEGTLSRGESLYASLTSSGLDASNVIEVLDALGAEVNLRSCKPGDSYTADVSRDGAIAALCYRKGIRERFRVRLDSTGYVVSKDDIPLVAVTRRVEGVILSSPWEALLDIGEDPQIALKLADVFAWEIDFVTDPRVGDSFVLIFEEVYCEGRKLEIGDVIGARYVNDGEEHLAFGFQDEDGRMQYYDAEGNSVRRVFLKSPLSYRRISSYFSHRRFHPILKVYRPHYGVDYAAPTGTPVVSIGDGRVTYSGWRGGLGNCVEIRHNNVYTSCYGHFSRIARGVSRGCRVRQGQVVGYVGATGLATGPHLDFRLKRFDSYINPLTVEYPRDDPIADGEKDAFYAVRDVILKGLKYRELAAASPIDAGT